MIIIIDFGKLKLRDLAPQKDHDGQIMVQYFVIKFIHISIEQGIKDSSCDSEPPKKFKLSNGNNLNIFTNVCSKHTNFQIFIFQVKFSNSDNNQI